jgi:hypothetical protein
MTTKAMYKPIIIYLFIVLVKIDHTLKNTSLNKSALSERSNNNGIIINNEAKPTHHRRE